MISQEKETIIRLISFKHSLLCKIIACLLIFTFLVTNTTYGYDRSDFEHLRQVRDAANQSDINTIEAKIQERRPTPPSKTREFLHNPLFRTALKAAGILVLVLPHLGWGPGSPWLAVIFGGIIAAVAVVIIGMQHRWINKIKREFPECSGFECFKKEEAKKNGWTPRLVYEFLKALRTEQSILTLAYEDYYASIRKPCPDLSDLLSFGTIVFYVGNNKTMFRYSRWPDQLYVNLGFDLEAEEFIAASKRSILLHEFIHKIVRFKERPMSLITMGPLEKLSIFADYFPADIGSLYFGDITKVYNEFYDSYSGFPALLDISRFSQFLYEVKHELIADRCVEYLRPDAVEMKGDAVRIKMEAIRYSQDPADIFLFVQIKALALQMDDNETVKTCDGKIEEFLSDFTPEEASSLKEICALIVERFTTQYTQFKIDKRFVDAYRRAAAQNRAAFGMPIWKETGQPKIGKILKFLAPLSLLFLSGCVGGLPWWLVGIAVVVLGVGALIVRAILRKLRTHSITCTYELDNRECFKDEIYGDSFKLLADRLEDRHGIKMTVIYAGKEYNPREVMINEIPFADGKECSVDVIFKSKKKLSDTQIEKLYSMGLFEMFFSGVGIMDYQISRLMDELGQIPVLEGDESDGPKSSRFNLESWIVVIGTALAGLAMVPAIIAGIVGWWILLPLSYLAWRALIVHEDAHEREARRHKIETVRNGSWRRLFVECVSLEGIEDYKRIKVALAGIRSNLRRGGFYFLLTLLELGILQLFMQIPFIRGAFILVISVTAMASLIHLIFGALSLFLGKDGKKAQPIVELDPEELAGRLFEHYGLEDGDHDKKYIGEWLLTDKSVWVNGMPIRYDGDSDEFDPDPSGFRPDFVDKPLVVEPPPSELSKMHYIEVSRQSRRNGLLKDVERDDYLIAAMFGKLPSNQKVYLAYHMGDEDENGFKRTVYDGVIVCVWVSDSVFIFDRGRDGKPLGEIRIEDLRVAGAANIFVRRGVISDPTWEDSLFEYEVKPVTYSSPEAEDSEDPELDVNESFKLIRQLKQKDIPAALAQWDDWVRLELKRHSAFPLDKKGWKTFREVLRVDRAFRFFAVAVYASCIATGIMVIVIARPLIASAQNKFHILALASLAILMLGYLVNILFNPSASRIIDELNNRMKTLRQLVKRGFGLGSSIRREGVAHLNRWDGIYSFMTSISRFFYLFLHPLVFFALWKFTPYTMQLVMFVSIYLLMRMLFTINMTYYMRHEFNRREQAVGRNIYNEFKKKDLDEEFFSFTSFFRNSQHLVILASSLITYYAFPVCILQGPWAMLAFCVVLFILRPLPRFLTWFYGQNEDTVMKIPARHYITEKYHKPDGSVKTKFMFSNGLEISSPDPSFRPEREEDLHPIRNLYGIWRSKTEEHFLLPDSHRLSLNISGGNPGSHNGWGWFNWLNPVTWSKVWFNDDGELLAKEDVLSKKFYLDTENADHRENIESSLRDARIMEVREARRENEIINNLLMGLPVYIKGHHIIYDSVKGKLHSDPEEFLKERQEQGVYAPRSPPRVHPVKKYEFIEINRQNVPLYNRVCQGKAKARLDQIAATTSRYPDKKTYLAYHYEEPKELKEDEDEGVLGTIILDGLVTTDEMKIKLNGHIRKDHVTFVEWKPWVNGTHELPVERILPILRAEADHIVVDSTIVSKDTEKALPNYREAEDRDLTSEILRKGRTGSPPKPGEFTRFERDRYSNLAQIVHYRGGFRHKIFRLGEGVGGHLISHLMFGILMVTTMLSFNVLGESTYAILHVSEFLKLFIPFIVSIMLVSWTYKRIDSIGALQDSQDAASERKGDLGMERRLWAFNRLMRGQRWAGYFNVIISLLLILQLVPVFTALVGFIGIDPGVAHIATRMIYSIALSMIVIVIGANWWKLLENTLRFHPEMMRRGYGMRFFLLVGIGTAINLGLLVLPIAVFFGYWSLGLVTPQFGISTVGYILSGIALFIHAVARFTLPIYGHEEKSWLTIEVRGKDFKIIGEKWNKKTGKFIYRDFLFPDGLILRSHNERFYPMRSKETTKGKRRRFVILDPDKYDLELFYTEKPKRSDSDENHLAEFLRRLIAPAKRVWKIRGQKTHVKICKYDPELPLVVSKTEEASADERPTPNHTCVIRIMTEKSVSPPTPDKDAAVPGGPADGSPYTIFGILRTRFAGEFASIEDIQRFTNGGRKRKDRKLLEDTIERDLSTLFFLGLLETESIEGKKGKKILYKATDLSPPEWRTVKPLLERLRYRPTRKQKEIAKEIINSKISLYGAFEDLGIPVARSDEEFPLTLPLDPQYVHSLKPASIEHGSETEKLELLLRTALFVDVHEPRLGVVDIPDGLIKYYSKTFLFGRIHVTCFRVKRFDSPYYVFSISNKETVIGHGVVHYIPDTREVQFRFSIHGGRCAVTRRDFRREYHGHYGQEALACMMAMCVNSNLFEKQPIDKFSWFSIRDDLENPEMEAVGGLLKKAGFEEITPVHYEFDMKPQEPLTEPAPPPPAAPAGPADGSRPAGGSGMANTGDVDRWIKAAKKGDTKAFVALIWHVIRTPWPDEESRRSAIDCIALRLMPTFGEEFRAMVSPTGLSPKIQTRRRRFPRRSIMRNRIEEYSSKLDRFICNYAQPFYYASWLHGNGNVNIKMQFGKKSFWGGEIFVLTVFPIFTEEEYRKHHSTLYNTHLNYPDLIPGSLEQVLFNVMYVDGEPAIVIREIQAAQGFIKLPNHIIKQYAVRWVRMAAECIAALSQEIGIANVYSLTGQSARKIGCYHMLRHERQNYREPFKYWQGRKEYRVYCRGSLCMEARKPEKHELYKWPSRITEEPPLSNFEELGPQFMRFSDFHPLIEDGRQRVFRRGPVYVTVDFNKPVPRPELLRLALHYGDPNKKDRWLDIEGELAEPPHERSYRFKVGLPKRPKRILKSKEYTLKVSYDEGRTWAWMGWNITPIIIGERNIPEHEFPTLPAAQGEAADGSRPAGGSGMANTGDVDRWIKAAKENYPDGNYKRRLKKLAANIETPEPHDETWSREATIEEICERLEIPELQQAFRAMVSPNGPSPKILSQEEKKAAKAILTKQPKFLEVDSRADISLSEEELRQLVSLGEDEILRRSYNILYATESYQRLYVIQIIHGLHRRLGLPHTQNVLNEAHEPMSDEARQLYESLSLDERRVLRALLSNNPAFLKVDGRVEDIVSLEECQLLIEVRNDPAAALELLYRMGEIKEIISTRSDMSEWKRVNEAMWKIIDRLGLTNGENVVMKIWLRPDGKVNPSSSTPAVPEAADGSRPAGRSDRRIPPLPQAENGGSQARTDINISPSIKLLPGTMPSMPTYHTIMVNGEDIGYIAMLETQKSIIVSHIWIAPNRRGQGIGTTVLSYLRKKAVSADKSFIIGAEADTLLQRVVRKISGDPMGASEEPPAAPQGDAPKRRLPQRPPNRPKPRLAVDPHGKHDLDTTEVQAANAGGKDEEGRGTGATPVLLASKRFEWIDWDWAHEPNEAVSLDGRCTVKIVDANKVLLVIEDSAEENLDRGHRLLSPEGERQDGSIVKLALSPDRRFLAVGGSNLGFVQVWDSKEWKFIRTLSSRCPDIYSLAFSPNARLLVAGDSFGKVHIWDTEDWTKLMTLDGPHETQVYSVAFLEDGRWLATGCGRRVNVWGVAELFGKEYAEPAVSKDAWERLFKIAAKVRGGIQRHIDNLCKIDDYRIDIPYFEISLNEDEDQGVNYEIKRWRIDFVVNDKISDEDFEKACVTAYGRWFVDNFARHTRGSGDYESILKDMTQKFRLEKVGIITEKEVAGKTILDVGTGRGFPAIKIAEGGAERVIGLDISDRAIAEARKNAEERNLKNIEFVRGSILDLPFNNGMFDAVYISNVLLYYPGEIRKLALKELSRVLKPEGTIYIIDGHHELQSFVDGWGYGWSSDEWKKQLMTLGFDKPYINMSFPSEKKPFHIRNVIAARKSASALPPAGPADGSLGAAPKRRLPKRPPNRPKPQFVMDPHHEDDLNMAEVQAAKAGGKASGVKGGLKLFNKEIPVVFEGCQVGHFSRKGFLTLLGHSAKDAKTTNDVAIDFSKRTQKPVLVVGIARTGCPYTWALDRWWSQFDNPKEGRKKKEEFDEQVDRLRVKRRIGRKQAEFIVAQQWLNDGIIKWYIDVIAEFIKTPDGNKLFLLTVKPFTDKFLKKWKRTIEETSLNLLFVDDSNYRKYDYRGRFKRPYTFTIVRENILSEIKRKKVKPRYYYINADEGLRTEWREDRFSVVFMRPARRITNKLASKIPRRNLKRRRYAWFDDYGNMYSPELQALADKYYRPRRSFQTNIGPIYTYQFIELKFKELTGWFERNHTNLVSYAIEKGYIDRAPPPPPPQEAADGAHPAGRSDRRIPPLPQAENGGSQARTDINISPSIKLLPGTMPSMPTYHTIMVNGEDIGYIAMLETQKSIIVSHIWIAPNRRGQGIGTTVLSYLRKKAVSADKSFIIGAEADTLLQRVVRKISGDPMGASEEPPAAPGGRGASGRTFPTPEDFNLYGGDMANPFGDSEDEKQGVPDSAREAEAQAEGNTAQAEETARILKEAKLKNTLGERIDFIRRDIGWTLDELARRTGITTTQIRNIIHGRTENPYMSTINKIAVAFADALGVESNVLLREVLLPLRKTTQKILETARGKKAIKQKLDYFLWALRWTMGELARRSGISAVQIRRIRYGMTEMPRNSIVAMIASAFAHYLGVEEKTLIEIFSDTDGEPPAARPKTFNVELLESEETAPPSYEELEIAGEYDGLYLRHDLGIYARERIYTDNHKKLTEKAAILGRTIDEALHELMDYTRRASDDHLEKDLNYMLNDGLSRHNGTVIQVARNLAQNAAIYKNPQGGIILVLSNDFIDATLYNLRIESEIDPKIVLWPLAERLFHELSHSDVFNEVLQEVDEECECVYRDYLLLKYVLLDPSSSDLKEGVREYMQKLQDWYRSRGYYRFLHELVGEGLEDEEARRKIVTYVYERYKVFQEGVKGFPSGRIKPADGARPVGGSGMAKAEQVAYWIRMAKENYPDGDYKRWLKKLAANLETPKPHDETWSREAAIEEICARLEIPELQQAFRAMVFPTGPSPSSRYVQIKDLKTDKVRTIKRIDLIRQIRERKIDDVEISGDRLNSKGSLFFGVKKDGSKNRICTFSKHPNRRIRYQVHNGKVDRTTIILLDDKGRPLKDGMTMYAVDLITGKVRCHFPRRGYTRLFKQLDNVEIVNHRLGSQGQLVVGISEKGKKNIICTFAKHPNRKLRYQIHNGKVDRTTVVLLDKKGRPLKDGKTLYAVDLATGKVRCHLSHMFFTNLIRRLDNVEIVNDRLHGKGGVLSFGITKDGYANTIFMSKKYSDRPIKYHVHDGVITEVFVLTEDGKAVLEWHILKLVRDKAGKLIDSFSHIARLPIKLNPLLKRGEIGSIEHLRIQHDNTLTLSTVQIYDFESVGDFKEKNLTAYFDGEEEPKSFSILTDEGNIISVNASDVLCVPRVAMGAVYIEDRDEYRKVVFSLRKFGLSLPERHEIMEKIQEGIEQLPPGKRQLARDIIRILGDFDDVGDMTRETQVAEELAVKEEDVLEILRLISETKVLQSIMEVHHGADPPAVRRDGAADGSRPAGESGMARVEDVERWIEEAKKGDTKAFEALVSHIIKTPWPDKESREDAIEDIASRLGSILGEDFRIRVSPTGPSRVHINRFNPERPPKMVVDAKKRARGDIFGTRGGNWVYSLQDDSICFQACIEDLEEAVGIAIANRVTDFTPEEPEWGWRWDRSLNPKLRFVIYVKEAYRHMGIGSALCDIVMHYAQNNGYRLVGYVRLCGVVAKQLSVFLEKEKGFNRAGLPSDGYTEPGEVLWMEIPITSQPDPAPAPPEDAAADEPPATAAGGEGKGKKAVISKEPKVKIPSFRGGVFSYDVHLDDPTWETTTEIRAFLKEKRLLAGSGHAPVSSSIIEKGAYEKAQATAINRFILTGTTVRICVHDAFKGFVRGSIHSKPNLEVNIPIEGTDTPSEINYFNKKLMSHSDVYTKFLKELGVNYAIFYDSRHIYSERFDSEDDEAKVVLHFWSSLNKMYNHLAGDVERGETPPDTDIPPGLGALPNIPLAREEKVAPEGTTPGSAAEEAREDHITLEDLDFEHAERCGEGKFGKIWKIPHKTNGRIYAVKVYCGEAGQYFAQYFEGSIASLIDYQIRISNEYPQLIDEGHIQRFYSGGECHLDYRGEIAKSRDFGRPYHYVIMDYIPGRNVHSFLDALYRRRYEEYEKIHGPKSLDDHANLFATSRIKEELRDKLYLFLSIARALSGFVGGGLVLKDFKPEHFIIRDNKDITDPNQDVTIIDMDHTVPMGYDWENNPLSNPMIFLQARNFKYEECVLTEQPERLKEMLTPQWNVYSFGRLMFELLDSGVIRAVMFSAKQSEQDDIGAFDIEWHLGDVSHVSEPRFNDKKLNNAIRALFDIIRKCAAKRNIRYQNMDGVIRDLEKCVEFTAEEPTLRKKPAEGSPGGENGQDLFKDGVLSPEFVARLIKRAKQGDLEALNELADKHIKGSSWPDEKPRRTEVDRICTELGPTLGKKFRTMVSPNGPSPKASKVDDLTSLWQELPRCPFKRAPQASYATENLGARDRHLGRYSVREALKRLFWTPSYTDYYIELTNEPTIGDIVKIYKTSKSKSEEISILNIEGKWFLLRGNSPSLPYTPHTFEFKDVNRYLHTQVELKEKSLDPGPQGRRYPSFLDLGRVEHIRGYHFIITEKGISAYSKRKHTPLFIPFAKLDPKLRISEVIASVPPERVAKKMTAKPPRKKPAGVPEDATDGLRPAGEKGRRIPPLPHEPNPKGPSANPIKAKIDAVIKSLRVVSSYTYVGMEEATRRRLEFIASFPNPEEGVSLWIGAGEELPDSSIRQPSDLMLLMGDALFGINTIATNKEDQPLSRAKAEKGRAALILFAEERGLSHHTELSEQDKEKAYDFIDKKLNFDILDIDNLDEYLEDKEVRHISCLNLFIGGSPLEPLMVGYKERLENCIYSMLTHISIGGTITYSEDMHNYVESVCRKYGFGLGEVYCLGQVSHNPAFMRMLKRKPGTRPTDEGRKRNTPEHESLTPPAVRRDGAADGGPAGEGRIPRLPPGKKCHLARPNGKDAQDQAEVQAKNEAEAAEAERIAGLAEAALGEFLGRQTRREFGKSFLKLVAAAILAPETLERAESLAAGGRQNLIEFLELIKAIPHTTEAIEKDWDKRIPPRLDFIASLLPGKPEMAREMLRDTERMLQDSLRRGQELTIIDAHRRDIALHEAYLRGTADGREIEEVERLVRAFDANVIAELSKRGSERDCQNDRDILGMVPEKIKVLVLQSIIRRRKEILEAFLSRRIHSALTRIAELLQLCEGEIGAAQAQAPKRGEQLVGLPHEPNLPPLIHGRHYQIRVPKEHIEVARRWWEEEVRGIYGDSIKGQIISNNNGSVIDIRCTRNSPADPKSGHRGNGQDPVGQCTVHVELVKEAGNEVIPIDKLLQIFTMAFLASNIPDQYYKDQNNTNIGIADFEFLFNAVKQYYWLITGEDLPKRYTGQFPSTVEKHIKDCIEIDIILEGIPPAQQKDIGEELRKSGEELRAV